MTSAVVTLLGLVSVVSVQVDESPAPASPPPEEALLVVVERAHGATATPEAIRRAIADELKRPVVGPTDAAGKSATQMLVVTLAPDSVTIQMRAAGDATARRHVRPLTTGESSLRVVAITSGAIRVGGSCRRRRTTVLSRWSGSGGASRRSPRSNRSPPGSSATTAVRRRRR